MSESASLTEEARAAALGVLVEVTEGTTLWSFSARITTDRGEIEVGWPFTSWALSEWLKGDFVNLVSDDWWTSRALPAPGWVDRASVSNDFYVLVQSDALELAADIRRWRADVDGVVEAVPTLSAPVDSDDWITWLEVSSTTHPPIGPDVVSRAQARASASIDTSELNRWFIFPAHEPTDEGQ